MLDEIDCHVNMQYTSVAQYLPTSLFRKLKRHY